MKNRPEATRSNLRVVDVDQVLAELERAPLEDLLEAVWRDRARRRAS